jgi:hypothetical protein
MPRERNERCRMTDELTACLLNGLPKYSDTGSQPIEYRDVHRALLPVTGDDDLARKRLMSLAWRERVPAAHQDALAEVLSGSTDVASLRAGETWKNVWWFVGVPPTASVHLFANRQLKWRMYGAGIPFYLEGHTDGGGYAKLYVGWGIAFASIDVLTGPNDYVQAIFEAFPGPRPTPGQ